VDKPTSWASGGGRELNQKEEISPTPNNNNVRGTDGVSRWIPSRQASRGSETRRDGTRPDHTRRDCSLITALDCVKKVANAAVFIWQLISDVFSCSLHGYESIPMLGNESIQREVALAFPEPRVQELFMSLYLCFPFVLARILICLSKPSFSSILRTLEGLDRCWI
jgi:hypothetical protein